MIIDFEHHYIPAEVAAAWEWTRVERTRCGPATRRSIPSFSIWKRRSATWIASGIDVAVQSCILGWDATLENCRLINDCTAQMQKDYPGRFVGLAHAPVLEEAGLHE